jgi:hypothetical protein
MTWTEIAVFYAVVLAGYLTVFGVAWIYAKAFEWIRLRFAARRASLPLTGIPKNTRAPGIRREINFSVPERRTVMGASE